VLGRRSHLPLLILLREEFLPGHQPDQDRRFLQLVFVLLVSHTLTIGQQRAGSSLRFGLRLRRLPVDVPELRLHGEERRVPAAGVFREQLL
jgi:hypothetical protein